MPNTGDALRDWMLALAGNAVIIICAIAAIQFLAQQAYGRFIGFALVAIVAVGFVYMPDQTVTLFRNIYGLFVS